MTNRGIHFDGDFQSDMKRGWGRRAFLGGLAATLPGAAMANCIALPETTQGPYPANGTRHRGTTHPNILTEAGVIREDIRTSLGDLSGEAEGVPMDVTLTVQNTSASCAALSGYAVYIWHCDSPGQYSIYENEAQNYLRGMQISDANGKVHFTTIVPGTYRGRWPHIHFQIFSSAEAAVSGEGALTTGQVLLEEALVRQYYDAPVFGRSKSNLDALSLSTDGVFRRHSAEQIEAETLQVVSADASEVVVEGKLMFAA